MKYRNGNNVILKTGWGHAYNSRKGSFPDCLERLFCFISLFLESCQFSCTESNFYGSQSKSGRASNSYFSRCKTSDLLFLLLDMMLSVL